MLTFAVVLNYVFVPPTPLGAPPTPPPTLPNAGTETPIEIPVESAPPAQPVPAGGGEAPEFTWRSDDQAIWLRCARQEIFEAEIG